jgi:hypothetical protein
LRQIGISRHKENPETVAVSGFLNVRKRNRLSLGELGSAASSLQAVLLLLAEPKTLDIQGFLASLSDFNP